ncbi:MAG TPA: phospholipase A2 [Acidimicrobiales bacterium]|nr:phospholipase A2 [Acidimicrobiales bacterium]
MRRAWCAVLLVVAALGLAVAPAGAQQVPPDIATLIDAFPDGGACTGVPDAIPGVFDFTAACAAHDACYASGAPQLQCDDAFRQAMNASCAAAFPSALDGRRYVCLTFAQLYYFGVRLFGQFFL